MSQSHRSQSIGTPVDKTGRNTQNVYHDKGAIVVHSAYASLPQICLKTGVPTMDLFRFEDLALPRSTRIWASVLGGAIGYSIAKKNFGKPVVLSLPLSNQWKQSASSKSKSSWVGVGVAVGFLLLGLFLSFFHGIFIILGFVGMIVSLVVAFISSNASQSPFRVSDIQDDWIWISGVKPEVAARFPALP